MSILCEIQVPSLANEMLVGICRCCLSNGYRKDMLQVFSWLGEDEIYCEMLIDCFSIKISENYSSTSERYLICDICITRLRDAAKFKEQVIAAQINFQNVVTKGSKNRFGVDEIVKIEQEMEEEIDSEKNVDIFIINQNISPQKTSSGDEKNQRVTTRETDLNLCRANDPLIVCQTCGNTYASIEQYSKHKENVLNTKINIKKSLCKNPKRIQTSFTDVCDWDLLNECKHVAMNENIRDRRSIGNKRNALDYNKSVTSCIGNLKRAI